MPRHGSSPRDRGRRQTAEVLTRDRPLAAGRERIEAEDLLGHALGHDPDPGDEVPAKVRSGSSAWWPGASRVSRSPTSRASRSSGASSSEPSPASSCRVTLGVPRGAGRASAASTHAPRARRSRLGGRHDRARRRRRGVEGRGVGCRRRRRRGEAGEAQCRSARAPRSVRERRPVHGAALEVARPGRRDHAAPSVRARRRDRGPPRGDPRVGAHPHPHGPKHRWAGARRPRGRRVARVGFGQAAGCSWRSAPTARAR